MTVQLKGKIKRTAIGEGGYAIGIGYDPGDGVVNMIGYVLTPNTDYSEGSNIQDESHLVQSASPNSSDRYTRYPQATQGDWSEGGRQLEYVNASQFYSSQGFDTTTPGLLRTRPAAQTVSSDIGTPSTPPSFPAATDGKYWIVGRYDSSGSKNCIIGSPSTPLGAVASVGAGNHEIYALQRTPAGVFAATSGGIYLVDFTAPGSSVLWTSDVVDNSTYDSMAYFSEAAGGGLFYIKTSTGVVYMINAASATPEAIFTPPTMEGHVRAICSLATGVVMVCGSASQGASSNEATVYVFNGVATSYVTKFNGVVKAACEMNGSAFILGVLDQDLGKGNFTLFEYASSTFNIIDDIRNVAPEFQESTDAVPLSAGFKPGLETDGRYLYIGWQGMPGLMYDPYGAVPAITQSQSGNYVHFTGAAAYLDDKQDTRVILPTAASGVLDVYVSTDNSTCQILAYNDDPGDGELITSYFDFGVPTYNKLFTEMGFDFITTQAADSLTLSFRVDDDPIFHPAIVLAGPGNIIRAVMPVNTIGTRIQFKVAAVSGNFTTTPWVMRYYTVHSVLARIWDMTLQCRSDVDTYTGSKDQQGMRGVDLWANLANAKKVAGGNVYLYVADPTDPVGDGSFVGVVQAHIEDMRAKASMGINPAAQQKQNSGFDFERDVQVQIVEDVTASNLV